ncbi:hypothetical protein AAMO2058_000225000 [Amorphochlora amoebiformis]
MATEGETPDDRLNELLRKSRLFADFVAGKSSCAASELSSKKKKSSRRGRMKESEEDAILLKQEQSEETMDPVRLSEQPSNIEFGTMRQYQINALNWMIRLHDIKCNGILADEMGLGKTLESISLLAYLKNYRKINGPHLVIVPKSTSGNWMREFGRWCPSLSKLLYLGSKEERLDLVPKLGKTDVCVTTYEMVTREKGLFSKVKWYYIYIDEAHRIKNEDSLLSQVVRSFPSERRLLITGTPLQNNLHELWALLNFLLPEVFDSSVDFDKWFDVTKSSEAEEGKKQMVKRLHTILRPFLLRRLKKDVEKDLPPKVEMKVFTGLTIMQKAWYTKLLERDIDTLNSKSGSRMRLLNIVMQLRKICNHPYLFDGAEEGPPYFEGEHIVDNCGKMILLDKLLKRLKKRDSRVLIFSQMTRMLDILEDYCRYRRFNYCRIDGQTKQYSRDEQMDIFNAPDSKKFIFLLSTRAGGLGINLQTADTVVLYDSDWNPQMDLQAMDRAHRIGQKKQVNVYRFITDGTIEVKVVERAYRKLFLNAVVIREGRLQEKSKGLKTNELMKMVRFGAKEIFRSKEGTVSDEDIDTILRKSQERTKKDEEELKNSYDANLRDFSLDVTDANYQQFEGKDYTSARPETDVGWFIAPSKRERKQLYNRNKSQSFQRKGKTFRATTRHDFQFFNRPRLAELEKKIWEGKRKLKEEQKAEKRRLKNLARHAREREKVESAKEKSVSTSSASPEDKIEIEENQDTSTPAVKIEMETEDVKSEDSKLNSTPQLEEPQKKEEKPKVERMEESGTRVDGKPGNNEENDSTKPPENENNLKDVENPKEEKEEEDDDEDKKEPEKEEPRFLTEEEQNEKDHLEAEGFPTWSRQHLNDYVSACARFGRDQGDDIKHAVLGQTPEEVERYHNVFWPDRFKEIKDHEKILAKIERGEKKLKQNEEDRDALAKKVGRHRNPLATLSIPYSSNQPNRGYSAEEDRFLVVKMHELGYGEWETLKDAIRGAWQFRFDWFIKSRTTKELQQRCKKLLDLVKEDNLKYEASQKAARGRKKGKGSKRKRGVGKAKGRGGARAGGTGRKKSRKQ